MSWFKKPSTVGGVIYLLVVATMLVGLGTVATGAWRAGIVVMGASFGVAFAARCMLSDQQAGMLRIRRRYVDLTIMAVCSVGMFVLAAWIVDRP